MFKKHFLPKSYIFVPVFLTLLTNVLVNPSFGLWDKLLDGYLKYAHAAISFETPITFTGSNDITSAKFTDSASASYYLDPASSSYALLVNGNVGIGTTAPGVKLEVNGSVILGTKATANQLNAFGNIYLGSYAATSAVQIGASDYGSTYKTQLGKWLSDDTFSPFVTLDDGGNVGIGTASPGQKLSVAGTIESTSGGFKFPDATTQTTAVSGAGVPAGAVMFFNLTSCPTGWSALTAASGLTIVGRAANESIGSSVGTALTSLQNKTHTHTGPSHTHPQNLGAATYDEAYADQAMYSNTGSGGYLRHHSSVGASTAYAVQTGVSAGGTGATGTASTSDVISYIQYLVCQKT